MRILQETTFKKNKDKTLPISAKYSFFNLNKSNKILDCASVLWFNIKEHKITKEQKLKLAKMYTCKDRFCPFCNWRRQLKYSRLIFNFLKDLKSTKKLRFLFLTLTVKNCKIEDLKETIVKMQKAFAKMTDKTKQGKKWNNSILGYLRVLEYTIQKNNSNFVHPHFHILLAVEPKYFDTNKNLYLTKDDFIAMWQQALGADYKPSVDIKIIKPNKNKNDEDLAVVSEMCKYPMKDTDISRLSEEQFKILTEQLYRVRNINAGGILKSILQEVEKIDDDLVNLEPEDEVNFWIVVKEVFYEYEFGEKGLNYYKMECIT